MKSFLMTAFAVILFAGAAGCNQTNNATYEAEQLTLTQIRSTPGFSWFDGTVASYTPDAATIAKIAAEYQAKKQKVYLYVNPSCSCTGTKMRFPQTVRILLDAGVKEQDIIVVSMHNESDKQPFPDRFAVRGLPSFFITKSDAPIYAIQTIGTEKVLIANQPNQPDKPVEAQLMEEILLEGFKL
ncbi:hypothetical protein MASR2M18_20040 [Ignavibacteria bacterium]|nr:hypothetical protein [Bacteroidota bacterium]MCZ2132852.1 hypothetical protein [Bacteroidota bacterium]